MPEIKWLDDIGRWIASENLRIGEDIFHIENNADHFIRVLGLEMPNSLLALNLGNFRVYEYDLEMRVRIDGSLKTLILSSVIV